MRARLASSDGVVGLAFALVLDFAVVAFAAWTIVYDAFLVLGGSGTAAVIVWALTLPAAVLVAVRSAGLPWIEDRLSSIPTRVLIGLTVLVALSAGVVGFVRLGSNRRWDVAWALCVLSSLAVLISAWWFMRGGEESGPPPDAEAGSETWHFSNLVALAIGLVLAVLSLLVLRPDADDVFYVNRSTWVAQRDTFSLRDTVFSDEAFKSLQYPPIASFEALAGELARVLHVAAADVVYYLVPPVATLLAVIAMWRLLQLWSASWPLVALAVGLLFLLWGGAQHASFGNLFLARIWQGKVILLAAGIPLMYGNLARAASLNPYSLLLVFLTAVACLGLASTALLVVPLVAFAGSLPLARTNPLRAAILFVAAASYPVAVALVVHFLPGTRPHNPPELPVDLAPLDNFVKVFGTGFYAAIAALGILGGALALRARGRIAAAAAAVIFAAVLAPGMLRLGDVITGSGAILWRLVWVSPVPLLVGAVATLSRQFPGPRPAQIAVPALLALAIVASGTPLWSASNHAQLHAPSWKLDSATLSEAQGIQQHAGRGEVVLAPVDVSAAIASTTTYVKPVDPREDYVSDLRDAPGFHAAERHQLGALVNGEGAPTAAVRTDLALLQVAIACVSTGDAGARIIVQQAGYSYRFSTGDLACYSR